MLGRMVLSAALLLPAASAAAADLFAPDPGPTLGALRPGFAPELPPPTFSWTGGHVGVNLGAALGAAAHVALTGNDAARAAAVASGERPAGESIGRSGIAGGVQLGYDYELRSLFGFGDAGLVLGAEADIDGAAVSGNLQYMSDRASVFASRTDYVGTLRARVGYASGSLLVYATGGFAYGGTADSASFLNPAGRQTYAGSASTIRTGYAVGGGVEAALPRATTAFGLPLLAGFGGDVTARLELLHYELGGGSFLVRNDAGLDPGYTQRTRDSGTLVRVGLNYKFGTAPTPPATVVARY